MPVLPRALEIQGEITAIRRDIHAHPELAYQEARTSDIVAARLQEWGLEVTRGLGKTGLVGTLRKGNSLKSSTGLWLRFETRSASYCTSIPCWSSNRWSFESIW